MCARTAEQTGPASPAGDANGQELVRATCPLCEHSCAAAIARHPRVEFARCNQCGLIYRRSHSLVEDPDVEAGVFMEPNHRRYSKRGWRRVQKSRHQVLDLLNHSDGGPLLDVGCSLGYTSLAAKDLGLPCTGVDVRAQAVNYCRSLSFRAEIGSLQSLPFGDGEFQLGIL